MHFRGERLQVRARQFRKGQTRQVAVPQVENAWCEPEGVTVRAHIAEVDEGEEKPPRRRPGQSGCRRDLADRLPRVVGIECPDHRQPSGQ